MAKKTPTDENITLFPEAPHKKHLAKHGKPDSKSKVKDVILELEEHGLTFTREEIVKHAKHTHLPEAEINAVIDELIAEDYLQYVRGAENLLTRSVWRDFSPAFEEYPDY